MSMGLATQNGSAAASAWPVDPGRPRVAPGHPGRAELGRFLKACRAKLKPEDVGLPPGPRRRTPGLRREEVALLAGVSRTLRLGPAERWHLYRLAEATPMRSWAG